MARCFIAVNLPEEIKEKIGKLAEKLDVDGIKPVETNNLHITLKFLGEIDDETIGKIENTLDKIKLDKFNISIEGIGVFPNENYVKVVWIGCISKELEMLAETIDTNLKEKFQIESEHFVGHLTIARVKRKIDLSKFLNENRNVKIGTVEVNSFELMESKLTPNGPEYSAIKRFILS